MRLEPLYYSWTGYARAGGGGMRELVGGITHVTDDPRYSWLNNAYCALVGEVRPRSNGGGFDVVLEVSEAIWKPTP